MPEDGRKTNKLDKHIGLLPGRLFDRYSATGLLATNTSTRLSSWARFRGCTKRSQQKEAAPRKKDLLDFVCLQAATTYRKQNDVRFPSRTINPSRVAREEGQFRCEYPLMPSFFLSPHSTPRRMYFSFVHLLPTATIITISIRPHHVSERRQIDSLHPVCNVGEMSHLAEAERMANSDNTRAIAHTLEYVLYTSHILVGPRVGKLKFHLRPTSKSARAFTGSLFEPLDPRSQNPGHAHRPVKPAPLLYPYSSLEEPPQVPPTVNDHARQTSFTTPATCPPLLLPR